MKRLIASLIVMLSLFIPRGTKAALKIIEDRMKMGVDTSGFPSEQQEAYKIFRKRCSKHHGLYRPIRAIKTGKTPVTESKFGKEEVKRYIVKMMRKPNSGINRDNAKHIIKFIYYLIDNKSRINETVD